MQSSCKLVPGSAGQQHSGHVPLHKLHVWPCARGTVAPPRLTYNPVQAAAYPLDTLRRRMQISGSLGQAVQYKRSRLLKISRALGLGVVRALINGLHDQAHVLQAAAYPLDTLRRRMQISGSLGQAVQYSSYRNCLRRMVRDEGVSSLYRGIGVNRCAHGCEKHGIWGV